MAYLNENAEGDDVVGEYYDSFFKDNYSRKPTYKLMISYAFSVLHQAVFIPKVSKSDNLFDRYDDSIEDFCQYLNLDFRSVKKTSEEANLTDFNNGVE